MPHGLALVDRDAASLARPRLRCSAWHNHAAAGSNPADLWRTNILLTRAENAAVSSIFLRVYGILRGPRRRSQRRRALFINRKSCQWRKPGKYLRVIKASDDKCCRF